MVREQVGKAYDLDLYFSFICAPSTKYNSKMPDKKLPAVPETILKRRKRQAAARAERAKATVAAKKASHATRKEVFQRAEKYVKQYREKERDEIRLKREAKKNNGYVDGLAESNGVL